MPDRFRFDSNDPLVTTYLSVSEIGNVPRWQSSFDYEFEFHTGHTTGNPIYIRPDGNNDKSNLPKFDTLNKSKSDYKKITDFANGGKLKSSLRNTAQQDILDVVSQSWASLSLLAERYWTGTVPNVVNIVNVVTTKTCNVPNCGGTVDFSLGGKQPCDRCYKFQ